jgi:hypothetical protein
MKNHPVKETDSGARLQCSHGKSRYLNNGPIHKGPKGGFYQGSKTNPRHLLHVESIPAKLRKK